MVHGFVRLLIPENTVFRGVEGPSAAFGLRYRMDIAEEGR